MQLSVLTI